MLEGVKCRCCGEVFDRQFVRRLKNVENHVTTYANVCERCGDDLAAYDDETNEIYVIVEGRRFV